MPRPTAAQFCYGFATVVSATLALLLLPRTQSGVGITLVVCVALALGLLVAILVPPRRPTPAASPARRAATAEARVPVQRLHTGAEPRVAEHSLHK
ncbi:hypothetical protein ACX6XY_29405 [Streptomyces sp. O3]